MLSDLPETEHKKALADAGLNVPFGARCFLTSSLRRHSTPFWISLNAPYGARCFLTKFLSEQHLDLVPNVLMHLMALGAF